MADSKQELEVQSAIVEKLRLEVEYDQERLKHIKDRVEFARTEFDIQQNLLKIEKASLENQKALSKELLQELKNLEAKEKKRGLLDASNKQEIKDKQAQQKLLLEQIVSEEKRLKILEKGLLTQQEQLEALENLKGTTKGLLSIVVSDQWKGGFFGQLSLASETSAGFAGALKQVGKGLAETFTPANMLGSALAKVQEASLHLMYEQDEVVSNFNKATAAAGKYDATIKSLGHSELQLGIDTRDVADAVLALRDTYTDFTRLSASEQKNLIKLTATMNEFGVSSQITAQNLQIMTTQLGMSNQESRIAQKEIAATADVLGVSLGKVASDFAQVGSELAALGRKGVQAFRELSAITKTTGIEVSRLLGIVEQFDTFEGAAEAVGKLNTILGGQFLDSMEMIMAVDPAQRFRLLRGAIDEAGVAFEDMSYYQRRAIASAAGLSNVAELGQLMKGSLNEAAEAASANALAQERMAEMARKAQSMKEKLMAVVHAFAIELEPLVDGIRGLADSFLELNKINKHLIPVMIGGIGVLALFVKVVKGFSAVKLAATTVLGANTTAHTANAAAQRTSALASIASSSALRAKAKAMTTAIPVMLSFGATVLMVGAGIGLAAAGVSLLVTSIMSLFTLLIDNITILPNLAIQLVNLSGAIMLLSASMLALSGATIVGALTSFIGGNPFEKIADGIRMIAEAMDSIPTSKVVAFSTVIEGLPKLTASAERITTSQVENVGKIIENTTRSINTVNTTVPTAPASSASGERTIILQLGERELKRFVINVMDTQLNPRKV